MFVLNLAMSDLIMFTTHGLPMCLNMFISDHWIYGVLGCQLYACSGGIFGKFQYLQCELNQCYVILLGTTSILSMVLIGYDRFNVIVKGLSGTKITRCKALMMILIVWIYSVLCSIPPFLGWGGYALGIQHLSIQLTWICLNVFLQRVC